MGRKVNPNGFRIGYNKNWSSQWFSEKQYANYLISDSQIRGLILKKHHRSGISDIIISRNRAEIVVTIYSSKPGVLIGRSGTGTQDLKLQIENTLKQRPGFDKQIVRLNIVEIKNAETNARLVAENIAGQLERRIAVKRAIRQAIERATEKRVKGIKIRISGRLGGADIARSEGNSSGSIPLQTIRSNVDYALSEAHTTFGILGVKVWIYNGESTEMPSEASLEPTRQHKIR